MIALDAISFDIEGSSAMAGEDQHHDPDADFAEDAGFAEEAHGADEYADEHALDSGGSELDYAAEAPDEDEYDATLGSGEDLSGEFAAEAGDDASYGFDSVRATSRFEGDAMGNELSEDAGQEGVDDYTLSAEDAASASHLDYEDEAGGADAGYDEYEYAGSDSGEDVGFAEDAGANAADGMAGFTPVEDEATGFASAEDEEPEVTGFASVEDEEPEVTGFASVEDEEPEVTGFASVEDEEPAAPAEDEAPPAERTPEPEERSDGRRSGAVPKSALDAIFARAAEIKRKI